jgi:hypothetical protein
MKGSVVTAPKSFAMKLPDGVFALVSIKASSSIIFSPLFADALTSDNTGQVGRIWP